MGELPLLKQQKTRFVSSLQVSANLTDSNLSLTIVTAPWFYGIQHDLQIHPLDSG